ncbi:glycosyltransferase family 8 protein [Zasmidium cellare ATCC 36951]|uniref:Glycosyltransferase family 8 protein n=1 Tax=Zasmidium cellare ATCC 36951 TaxID=1080233 RepID=A0A6A6CDY8_ZASCE|nr:glycosyltransferase family 8 protein [Zasmidium cellare ATCC 36951]KAF2164913.1 glycosyltransferase family 8 protein [Zasmidium cellare ATCC 36951]
MVEALDRLGAKAEKLILHSEEWNTNSTRKAENGTEVYTTEARLLQKAQGMYHAVLQPVPVQRVTGDVTWSDSFTKLLAFNQTQYRRVLALDSDSTMLQPMDELFLLPPTPVAMPRAYWLEHELFDAITLITPSSASAARIQTAIATRLDTDFDMDIMNHVFGDSCMVLPHRDYALVTGEFRKQEPGQHVAYLGDGGEEWDAEKVVDEAKFVHFSDWPLGKPWVASGRQVKEEVRPKCTREGSMEEDCRDRVVWEGLYRDFRERRKAICGPELVDWESEETDWEVARLLSNPTSRPSAVDRSPTIGTAAPVL